MRKTIPTNLVYTTIVGVIVLAVFGAMLTSPSNQPPTDVAQLDSLPIVNPSELSQAEQALAPDAQKAASMPKMVVGLGDKQANTAVVTFKPKPEMVPEFKDAE